MTGVNVATASPQIDKLLATVIQLKASDLHITVGQPPVIRHHGRMRRLDTKVLEQDDTTSLMKSITPDRCQQELQEKGGSDFAIEFTDGYRFRVAIFKQRGNIGMVLRRIPSGFLTFEQIGMPEAVKRLITRPRGRVMSRLIASGMPICSKLKKPLGMRRSTMPMLPRCLKMATRKR